MIQLMIIKNAQMFIVVTILAQVCISRSASTDLFRPDNSLVIDMGKVVSGKRNAKSFVHRNRGRVRKYNQGDSFKLEHALVIVPGQSGDIGSTAGCFSRWLQKDSHKLLYASTPQIGDFGQAECMQDLHEVISKEANIITENMEYILFPTSQGTSTVVNFFNGKNAEIKNPKALLLQSIMLSGNSAIYHTVTNLMLPFVAYFPLSYYWMPYLAQIGYQSYSPGGEQPIFNVENIPTDLPIIILHCTNDKQLSFADAQGLYAALCKNGNQNVYFFEMPNSDGYVNHFVKFNYQTTKDILTILKNHKIIERKDDDLHDSYDDEIALRQPEVKQEWLDHFDDILKREKRIQYFQKVINQYGRLALATTFAGLIAYCVM
jgi:hypothetical protein